MTVRPFINADVYEVDGTANFIAETVFIANTV
jgi:hypothetical protein